MKIWHCFLVIVSLGLFAPGMLPTASAKHHHHGKHHKHHHHHQNKSGATSSTKATAP